MTHVALTLPVPLSLSYGIGHLVGQMLGVVLYIAGIVLVIKTADERLTASRLVWALIVILVPVIGTLIFLAAGRHPAPEPNYTPDTDQQRFDPYSQD